MSFFSRRKKDERRRRTYVVTSAEAPSLQFSRETVERAKTEWADNARRRAAANAASGRAA